METQSRFSDPYLNRFLQPDTIIPSMHNPQSLNRYSYVNNSPINYSDPSGHWRTEDTGSRHGCYDPKYCNGGQPKSADELKKMRDSTKKPKIASNNNRACGESNWSIVCKDPTLVTSGQVQTPLVYPTFQTPNTYDGPYVDKGCVDPFLCALLLSADAATGIQYQSNIPAYLGKKYMFANVNYEVHRGDFSNYILITGLEISNSTDSVFSITDVSFNNTRLQPTSTFLINPQQTISIPANSIAGSPLQINLRSPIYNPVSLSAIFP